MYLSERVSLCLPSCFSVLSCRLLAPCPSCSAVLTALLLARPSEGPDSGRAAIPRAPAGRPQSHRHRQPRQHSGLGQQYLLKCDLSSQARLSCSSHGLAPRRLAPPRAAPPCPAHNVCSLFLFISCYSSFSYRWLACTARSQSVRAVYTNVIRHKVRRVW